MRGLTFTHWRVTEMSKFDTLISLGIVIAVAGVVFMFTAWYPVSLVLCLVALACVLSALLVGPE